MVDVCICLVLYFTIWTFSWLDGMMQHLLREGGIFMNSSTSSRGSWCINIMTSMMVDFRSSTMFLWMVITKSSCRSMDGTIVAMYHINTVLDGEAGSYKSDPIFVSQ